MANKNPDDTTSFFVDTYALPANQNSFCKTFRGEKHLVDMATLKNKNDRHTIVENIDIHGHGHKPSSDVESLVRSAVNAHYHIAEQNNFLLSCKLSHSYSLQKCGGGVLMETDAKYRMAAQYWSRTSPPPRSSRSRSRSLFSMGNTRSSTATSSPGSLYREAIRKSNEFPTRKKSYYISAPDSIALQKNGVKFTFFWQNYPVEFCTKVVREVELMTIRAPETEDNNTMKVFKLIHHWVNLFRARRELKWAKEALNSRLAPLRVDATGVGPEFLIELFGCTCITEIVIPKVDNYMFKAIRRQSHIRHVETCFNDEFKWIPEVVSVRLKAADTKNFNYDLVGPYITRVTSKLTLDIKYNSLGTEVLNAFASLLEVMVDCMVINCDFDIICPSRSYDALKNMANTIAKLRDIVAKAYLMFPNINRRFMFTFPWRHVEDLDIKAHLLDLLKKQQINVIYRKNRRNEGIFTIPINDLTNCRFQFALQ